ncbi:MAG: hypothetical protein A3G94_02995 [Deltaproteobacteria bacterium RIFCSPLOWO2_12_FULL_60_16]|nr:MAG: hypothetical protein A3G94_02995 [Deltaproteobacteria bacterium RIFCSPLOWO2_12_FULL_60_16]
MFAYEDRKVPGRKEGGGGSEGARLEGADVGVGRLLAGPDRWSEQHRGGRGGGPQGTGPSAALGGVAPEEPACVSNQPLDEEALERGVGAAPLPLKLVRAPLLVLLSPFLFLFSRGTPLKPEKSHAA